MSAALDAQIIAVSKWHAFLRLLGFPDEFDLFIVSMRFPYARFNRKFEMSKYTK